MTKLKKNINGDNIQEIYLLEYSKDQSCTNISNSNCDKTKQLNFRPNFTYQKLMR